jgi:RNA polymerase sigma factor (sigma-70 family)
MAIRENQNTQPQAEFEQLMRRVSAGDEEAAWGLVETYGPHILRAVRRTLHPKVRQQFDSIDFVQAVWASLFVGRGKLLNVHRPEQLIALLTTVARNKVIDVVRQRTTTQKYDVGREVAVDREGVQAVATIASKDGTPSEFAMARECWDHLMCDQPDHYRRIIGLRLQGESYRDIADKLGISDKTVQRVLTKLLRERAV